MNNAINSFLKYVPKDDWILYSSHLPWLKLDLEVPTEDIIAEANQMYSRAVLHRADDSFGKYHNEGWRSLTLYGAGPEVTKESNEPHSWTEIADLCPKTVEFIERYWIIDEETRRIRFMYLEPGGYILPHTDRENKGFYEANIAITHPDNCVFRFMERGNVPFTPGSAFLVDISNRHLVYNDSDKVRTHIIVHAKLKPGIVQDSYAKNYYR